MKLEWHSRWLRFVVEFYPTPPEIRRYRVARAGLEHDIKRTLRQRILQRLARTQREIA
jgi:hypothetical protein